MAELNVEGKRVKESNLPKWVIPAVVVGIFAVIGAFMLGSGGTESLPSTLKKVDAATAKAYRGDVVTTMTRPAPPEAALYQNPVTGEDMSEAPTRPIAVVLNNVYGATPQDGIASYELMIEIPAEGEINRLLAVMYDYSGFEMMGSIRSIRDYVIKSARGFDPIYLHYGHSPQAIHYINDGANGITSLNGINGDIEASLYHRDEGRADSMGFVHSVVTTPEKIDATIEKFSVRTETDKTEPFFDFSGYKEGAAAESVTVQFEGGFDATFDYNGEVYERSQFGKPHIDRQTEETVTAETVIVIKTDIRTIPNDPEYRREVDIVGSGTGYVFSDGTAHEIEWSREGDAEFYEFKVDGEPLTLNQGKIWICITDTSRSVDYE